MKKQFIKHLRIGLASFMAVVLSGALPVGAAFAQTTDEAPVDTQVVVEQERVVENDVPVVQNNAPVNAPVETQSIVEQQRKVNDKEEEEEEAKVTLCHATGSESNPYVKITVAAAAAYNGHLGASHQNGEDIIPPFEYQGQTYSQNWNAEGQAIHRNDCVVEQEEPEPLKPAVAAVVVPCVPGTNSTDTVRVTVTNTDDETNMPMTYVVTLGGKAHTVTNLSDGASRVVVFGNLTIGTYTATVVGEDGSVTSNSVTVGQCAERGVVLSERHTSGGRGAAPVVLAAAPAPAVPAQLANTGEAQNPLLGLLAGFAVLAMTLGLAVLSRTRTNE